MKPFDIKDIKAYRENEDNDICLFELSTLVKKVLILQFPHLRMNGLEAITFETCFFEFFLTSR